MTELLNTADAPEGLDMIYLVLNAGGIIQSGNRSATRLLLGTAGSSDAPALSDVVHRNAAEAVEAALSSLRTGSRRVEVVAQLAGPSESAPAVYAHFVLSRDDSAVSPSGAGSPIVVQGWDVSSLMRRVHDLEANASHDSLTGAVNRSTFMDRLQHELSRSVRSGTALAVMFADIDGFKDVNDRYGHEMGDNVLIHVTRRLTECLRPADTLARLGGDEFAVICPDISSPEHAMTIADRLRQGAAEPLVTPSEQVAVTLSIGVAFAVDDDHEDPAAGLLRRADGAMYELKRARTSSRRS